MSINHINLKTRGYCNIGIHPKLILNWIPVKTRSPITFTMSVLESFWNFAQITALPCSVQNFKTTCRLSNKLCVDEVLCDFSFRWESGECSILQQSPGYFPELLTILVWEILRSVPAAGLPSQNSYFHCQYWSMQWHVLSWRQSIRIYHI